MSFEPEKNAFTERDANERINLAESGAQLCSDADSDTIIRILDLKATSKYEEQVIQKVASLAIRQWNRDRKTDA